MARTSDWSSTASPECRMSRHFLRDRSTFTWRPRNRFRRCEACSLMIAPRYLRCPHGTGLTTTNAGLGSRPQRAQTLTVPVRLVTCHEPSRYPVEGQCCCLLAPILRPLPALASHRLQPRRSRLLLDKVPPCPAPRQAGNQVREEQGQPRPHWGDPHGERACGRRTHSACRLSRS